MEMTKSQREELAGRLAAVRLERFGGKRKDAYTHAKVNSATWTKLENGDPVAERSLVAVLLALWPETGGDWRRMDPPLTGGDPLATEDWRAYIDSLGLSPAIKASVISTIEADRADAKKKPKRGESA